MFTLLFLNNLPLWLFNNNSPLLSLYSPLSSPLYSPLSSILSPLLSSSLVYSSSLTLLLSSPTHTPLYSSPPFLHSSTLYSLHLMYTFPSLSPLNSPIYVSSPLSPLHSSYILNSSLFISYILNSPQCFPPYTVLHYKILFLFISPPLLSSPTLSRIILPSAPLNSVLPPPSSLHSSDLVPRLSPSLLLQVSSSYSSPHTAPCLLLIILLLLKTTTGSQK